MYMKDLQIPAGPGAPHGLTVPAAELVERFTHSSVPGGQNVNTTDSQVQLSLDLGTTTALDERQRQRALRKIDHRLAVTIIFICSSDTCSQLTKTVRPRQHNTTL